ncbi:UNVERIFIED_CONTAM: hypothetical protein Sradi_0605800 [Sesamum radiatum]|uniref:MAPK kinase substrate protein At1g80180-like n=1 Tax=Sesamum radiatum TaxID=300843 RepID=A0AAW2VKP6_SESRA
MAGLQRSAVSFRRQGSSGLVWDDKFLAGLADQHKEDDNTKPQQESKQDSASPAPPVPARDSSPITGLTIERSRSNGGRGFRTGRVSPAIEPPSPKVSACGCCSAFGKSKKTRRRPPKSGKRVV